MGLTKGDGLWEKAELEEKNYTTSDENLAVFYLLYLITYYDILLLYLFLHIFFFFIFYSPYLPWKQFKQYACSPTVSSLIHSVHMVVVDTLIFLTNDT